jgi:uncharacterized protein (DUF58 family)
LGFQRLITVTLSATHILPDVLAHLDERQFRLAVRRIADSLSYGSDASPFLGSGIEFVQSRPYIPGDPVKSIDWKVTGRTGRVHVKEYEAPKRMPVYLLLDTSASMCVSSRAVSKYAWAVQLAGGMALAALSRLSPVGLIGCGERDLRVRPSLSRLQVMRWLHELRRFRLDERTSLARGLREARAMMDNRSMLIVLSDLHDPQALGVLKPIAREHDCVVLQLQDPSEPGRIGGGMFRAAEAETGEQFVAHGRSRWVDVDAAAREMKRSGIDHMRLPTDQAFLPRLRAFLARRDCLGRMAR